MKKEFLKIRYFSIFSLKGKSGFFIVFLVLFLFIFEIQIGNSSNRCLNIQDAQDAGIVLFKDDFNEKNSDYWYWRTDGNGYNTVENGIANFTIFNNATTNEYSNSEIYNHSSSPEYPYFYSQLHMKLLNTALVNGSRGWGFWNGNMNPTQSTMAWFTRLKGNETYQNNGFYAVVQSFGQMPTMINLTHYEYILVEWTNYSIDWTETYCAFYINDQLVANFTENLPDDYCRIDIWIDNAIYSDTWEHIFNTIDEDCSILLDWVKITEFWTPSINLEPPVLITESQTIEYDNITIEWNTVENAEGYNIYVNGIMNETTAYHLQKIMLNVNGSYEITITAVNGTRESLYSVPITIIVEIPPINTPDNTNTSISGYSIGLLLLITSVVIIVVKKKKIHMK